MQANAQSYLNPGQPSTPAPAPVSAPTPTSQGFVAPPDSNSTPVFNPQGQVAYIQNGASVPSGWSTTVPSRYSGYSSTYSNQAPTPAPVTPPSTNSAPTVANLGITAPPSGSSPTTTMPTSGLGSTAMTNQLLGVNAFDTTTGAPTGQTTPTGGNTGTTNNSSTTSPKGTPDGGITTTSTGNPELDAVIASLKATADSLLASGNLPANLQPTPALMQDFLAYAHSQADTYTKQLITNALPAINSNLQNLTTKYGNDMGQIIQDYGVNLNTEQNQAGMSGRDASGLRNLTESQLTAGANRQLSTLGSQAQTDIGSVARQGAAAVGNAYTPSISIPQLAMGSVSAAGGSHGSSIFGTPLNYNYDPNSYQVGSIQSGQDAISNQQAQAWNAQYTANARANTGRTMTDLYGMTTGATGTNIPNNLS